MDSQTALMPLLVLASACLTGCSEPNAKPGNTKKLPPPPPAQAPKVVEDKPQPTRAALIRPQPLPKMALVALQKRMQTHGDDMESLLWATLMLDYQSTDGIAKRMAATPTLSRPQAGQLDTINAMLPAEFFDLQDQLSASVIALRTAARAKDDSELGVKYGQIAETCIRCHSLYLRFPTPE